MMQKAKVSTLTSRMRFATIAAAWLVASCSSGLATAQSRPLPDKFTATTTDMKPNGVTVRADILEWSDDAARADAVAALAGDDIRNALVELPTIGYVWLGGSSVGYSIKYAHRETGENGSERITLVTDRVLGSYSFTPWTLTDADADAPAPDDLEYSVIEMQLGGEKGNTGTTSLAAAVVVDAQTNTVSLQEDAATPQILAGVKHEPKPYWASGG